MTREREREERLAAALRENLRKRKAQGRDVEQEGSMAPAPLTPGKES